MIFNFILVSRVKKQKSDNSAVNILTIKTFTRVHVRGVRQGSDVGR